MESCRERGGLVDICWCRLKKIVLTVFQCVSGKIVMF